MEEVAAGSSSHPKNKEEEHDDEEQEWEEYLQSHHSHETFAQYYRPRPMSLLANDTAADHYDNGNRVVMPQSALERLSSVEVEYPMVFRIQNAATRHASHVGVQEFVADEGFVHIPTHTMARLSLLHNSEAEDDDQRVLLTSTWLPKATAVKLQPHTSDFLRVKYPKKLLEYNFGRYTCMTVGDTITVVEGDSRYLLDIVEAKPADAVSTIETDCEVDFLPPLDYKEPPAPMSSQWTSEVEFTVRPGEVGTIEVPVPVGMATGRGEGQRFAGVGVRMNGKPVEPTMTVPAAAGPSAKGSNNKTALRFGGAASVPAAGKAGKKADIGDESKRFTGQKYFLKD